MSQLPTGTVTFLFTDIEGSTGCSSELGERLRELRTEHRRAMRAPSAPGGLEVDTRATRFFVAFASAPSLRAAADASARSRAAAARAHRAPHRDAAPRRRRLCGHRRTPAARIAAPRTAAGPRLGGDRDARRETLPTGLALRDLGEHRLQDLTAPQRLYQLARATG